MIGTRIAHYEITAKLGEGGMGEVYRATDTKLNRDVALKILPEQFASDSQRMGRFQREAEVLASLDHPNIGAIHGIEDVGETKALVLQLIEGPTLADRIAQGPISVDEALPIALQIAEALEAAHEKGIIHRDMKPANVKLTPEGQVKVLDFGLAKAAEPDPTSSPDITQSPTLSMAATQAGIVLGTAAYMSPEQVRGERSDRRSDIWSFGVTLHEMFTGTQLFAGNTISDTLASVLRSNIDLDLVPRSTPRRIVELLGRCLCRDVKTRLQAIGEARIVLADCLADPGVDVGDTHARGLFGARLIWQVALPAALAGALLASGGFWLAKSVSSSDSPSQIVRLGLEAPPGQEVSFFYDRALDISADGRTLVLAANPPGPSALLAEDNESLRLFRRYLDSDEWAAIEGSEGGMTPVLSPDGREVAFLRGDELLRLPVEGGIATPICDIAQGVLGMDWSLPESIVLAGGGGSIWRVNARGGELEEILHPETAVNIRAPQLILEGRAVLYSRRPPDVVWDEGEIVVTFLTDRRTEVLFRGGSNGRLLPSGHIVYTRGQVLWARGFDIDTLSSGPEFQTGQVVARDLYRNYGFGDGDAHFAVSGTGILVYVKGQFDPFIEHALFWRDGTHAEMLAGGTSLDEPRISPDGRSVATEVETEVGFQVHVCEVERCDWAVLDSDGADPVWSPDGSWVYFVLNNGNASGRQPGLYRRRSDFSAEAQFLFGAEEYLPTPESVGPDQAVWFTSLPQSLEHSLTQGKKVWVLPPEDEPRQLLTEPAMIAQIHPRGGWLAYVTPPQRGLFLRQLLSDGTPGRRITVDTLGYEPLWAPDGDTLYYRREQQLMAAPFSEGRLGPPRVHLDDFRPAGITNDRSNYAVAADGQVLSPHAVRDRPGQPGPAGESRDASLGVVINWFEDLNRRVSVQ